MYLPNSGIFKPNLNFSQKALELFRFQYAHNAVYKRYADALNCDAAKVNAIDQIPFLPISFFKQFPVITTTFEPQAIFESSGTTGMATSRHLVKDEKLYEESFMTAFEQFYGPVKDYCILGLLPSYLERSSSSLVYMVQHMIATSKHSLSGFYLYNFEELFQTLQQLQASGQKTLLIGVTYALLDFAAAFPLKLSNTIIMETGGMKGRKKELLRPEVHDLLKQAFGVDQIHSEYGMTELLSQAYSFSDGLFHTPSWMKVIVREEDDPLTIITDTQKQVSGAINIIDLANIYSCCFIATDDVGRLHPGGTFEVLGRMDNSDIRGCSLLAISNSI
ncbi:acyl transferase [Chitinophagaceae bacterium LB-8]|uniref:Acyl transferase n=1 Tax=Paraflavisolibacter caeni TaxID=2982496 RepID=A0A9X3B924_9BACT|nr:acyl transferase [Paraflavisolibacter caeni]MCU7550536.1 acyl transferase [Paraflavisolibacter caeni]